jgi:hypothetical protein
LCFLKRWKGQRAWSSSSRSPSGTRSSCSLTYSHTDSHTCWKPWTIGVWSIPLTGASTFISTSLGRWGKWVTRGLITQQCSLRANGTLPSACHSARSDDSRGGKLFPLLSSSMSLPSLLTWPGGSTHSLRFTELMPMRIRIFCRQVSERLSSCTFLQFGK